MRRFDLNLLYTLRELLKDPNTSNVGEKLGLTQSAVSAALSRLRDTFEDDLFVRSGRALKPTKRAEHLAEPVEDILRRVELLIHEAGLDPLYLRRRFRVMSAEYILSDIISELTQTLEKEAPGVTVVCEVATMEAQSRLRSGHIDVSIAPLEPFEKNISGFSHQLLYKDKLVCLTSKHNTEVGKELTAEQFLAMRHVVYKPDSTKATVLSASEIFLKELGIELNIAVEATSYSVLPGAIMNSNLIGTLPEYIFNQMPERDAFRVFELPFPMREFDVSMLWNSNYDKDVHHKWFRELIADHFMKVDGIA